MAPLTIITILSLALVASSTTSSTTTNTNNDNNVNSANNKNIHQKIIIKRGIPLWGDEFSTFPATDGFNGIKFAPGYPLAPWAHPSRSVGPSPSEVANAISIAKQASANVLIAQQQVQAAKENVLNQQKVAMDKETAATILTQKSEAAAAIQRSESAAAAQSVVLAQQRLAAAKAAVAHQQRIASAKEAEAAAALQSSARAAAVEIQRTENEATKFANYHRAGAAASAHHLAATKDAALSPITAGTNHIQNLNTLAWPSNQFGFNAENAPAIANPWSVSGHGLPSMFGHGNRHNFAW